MPAAGGGAGEAKAKSSSGGAATEAKGAGGDGGDGKAAASGPAAAAKEPSGGAAAPAELPKPNRDPHADPGFQAMKGRSKGAAGGAKAHTPAKTGAANAQGAAAPPSNDASSQAQAAQVDDMSTKEPGAFDREAFIAAVKEAIEKQAPKNLEEADEFKEGGADGVKTEVSGHVKKGKEGSEKDIKDSTNATPDASKAKPKQVEPMVNDDVGAGEKTVGAQGAMPPPTPAAHTDLSAGPDSIDSKMADAEVTEEQLKKSNEPSFNEALGAKDEAKDHSDKAPGDFRKDEKGVLAKAKGDAAGSRAAACPRCRASAARRSTRPSATSRARRPPTRPSGPRSPTTSRASTTAPRRTSRRPWTGSTARSTPRSRRARGRRARSSRTTSASAWTPTRRTVTAGSSVAPSGSRTSSSACRARSTPSTRRARPATSPTWTA